VCTQDDLNYILDAINHMLEIDKLEASDVISSWAGLRTLIQEEGKPPSELSRKDEIFESDSGFISIAGGKLTGYRKMAERIVDLIQERDDSLSQDDCITESIPLARFPLSNYNKVEEYITELSSYFKSIKEDSYYGLYLVSNYGRSADTILESFKLHLESGWPFEKALIKAEIDFCVEYECIFNPDDFFNRRTGMLYFDPSRLRINFDFIIECFSEIFAWGTSQRKRIELASREHIEDVLIIKD